MSVEPGELTAAVVRATPEPGGTTPEQGGSVVVSGGESRAPSRRSRLLGPLLAAGGVLAATGYVALVDPNSPGHYPLCPFKAMTGWDCPGCGGLRAVHDLAHGNLAAALDQNALAVVVLLPVAVVMWLGWLRRAWTGPRQGRPEPTPSRVRALWTRWAPYAGLALVIAFTVFRNLPVGHYFQSGLS